MNIKITPNGIIPHLLLDLAGRESDGWHPLISDFVLLGQKLEQLGFMYHKGSVTIIDLDGMAQ